MQVNNEQAPIGVPPSAPPTGQQRADTPAAAQYQHMDMAAVSLTSRIPDFWTDQPRIWFLQIESVLAPQHLSDQAKYDLVIGKLSKDVISQITNLIINPPATGKFQALKQRLLNIYEESASRQLQKLLSEMDLGDQKPSQLLYRMRELAREKIPDDTLRILWQSHLPSATRAVLAVADSKDLDALAATADKVMETTRPIQVHEVSNQQTESATILAEIAKLNLRIANLENDRSRPSDRSSQCRCTQRGRSRSRSRKFRPSFNRQSRDPSGSSSRSKGDPNWLCSYHYRYRENARSCVPPCAWKKQQEN